MTPSPGPPCTRSRAGGPAGRDRHSAAHSRQGYGRFAAVGGEPTTYEAPARAGKSGSRARTASAQGVKHLRQPVAVALACPERRMDPPPRPEGDRPHGDAGIRAREAEVRREGDAGSRGDETLHRSVVVELEANPRLEAGGAAGALGERVAGGAAGALDPRLVRQVEETDDALPGDGMRCGKHDTQRLFEQELELDPRVGGKGDVVVFEDDRQIELAHTHAGERDERVGLGDRHVDLGPDRGEANERIRDDADRCGRVRPDPQGRGRAVEFPELGLGLGEPLEDRLGMLDQPPTGRGQLHAARASLEQRDARLGLELRQLLGDRGRREAERLGGPGDRAAEGHLAQDTETPDVEHKQSLPIDVASRVVRAGRPLAALRRELTSPARLSAQARRREDGPAGADGAPGSSGGRGRRRHAGNRSRRHRRRPGRERRPGRRGDSRRPALGPGRLVRPARARRGPRRHSSARPRRRWPASCPARPTPLVLFRESTIAGTYFGLGGVDGLADWVTLRSGRLPRTVRAGALRGRPAARPRRHPERRGHAPRRGRGRPSSPRRCSSATSSCRPRTSRAAPRSAQATARQPGTTVRSRRRSSSPKGSTGWPPRPCSRPSTAATPGWRRWRPATCGPGRSTDSRGTSPAPGRRCRRRRAPSSSPRRSRSCARPPRRATWRAGGSCSSAVSPPPSSSRSPSSPP